MTPAALRRAITVAALPLAALLLAAPPATAALSVGKPAPDVQLQFNDGGVSPLSQLRGQVVLLNFWASWCGPCRVEMPALNTLYGTRHAKGLVLIGIDVDTDPADAAPALKDHPVSFPIALDRDGTASGRFMLDGMPMTVLIDRRGIVRWIHRGYSAGDEKETAHQVDDLLKEP